MAAHGLSLHALFTLFPDEATAEQWVITTRWPDGVGCHHCGSVNVLDGAAHKTMRFRCRYCRTRFSPRTGTAMHSSNLSYRVWVVAIHRLATSPKGVSSLQLARDLGITQRSAWHLAHRIREAWRLPVPRFLGPVEVDETFVGGREKNKHRRKRLRSGRWAGKIAVVGVKDRATNQVYADVIEHTDVKTLQGFVAARACSNAMVYSDGEPAYAGLPRHGAVNHHIGEYVRGEVHTQGIESFWALLKRGYKGVYHQMSRQHLRRYVTEFPSNRACCISRKMRSRFSLGDYIRK